MACMNSAEPSNQISMEHKQDAIDNKSDRDYYSESDNESGDDIHNSDPLKCRMYENDYPEQGDIIMVEIKKIVKNVGAYCTLLEYNNIEGLLLNTELGKKRIRSIKSIIKEGRQEIVQAYKVDKSQHFINLSKKWVEQEDIPLMEEKWGKSKAAHSIMRQVSVLCNKKYSMKQLYKLFGWQCANDFGHLYDAFKFAINNWDTFIQKYAAMPKEIQPCLQKMIERRLKPQSVTVRAKVEITCFTYEGVDAVKRALKAGFEVIDKINNEGEEEQQEGVFYDGNTKLKMAMSPPEFTVSASTYDANTGIKLVNDIIHIMGENISQSKGTLTVKRKAQIISDQ